MTDTTQHQAELAQVQEELQFFMALGRQLTATLDDQEVLAIIARGVHDYLRPSHTTLYVTGGERRVYRLTEACGYTPPDDVVFSILEGCCGEVLRTGQPMHLDAEALASQEPRPEDLVMPGPLSEVLVVPILHRKRPLAALIISLDADASPLTDAHHQRLERLLEQSHMAVDRALLYRRTADLAITDDLTQLFNHRYIRQFLDMQFSPEGHPDQPLGLLFLDLDKFKAINDTHGHLAGSKALGEVAVVLSDNLRSGDVIARYGGDEFVVILPNTTIEVSLEIANRLCKAIEETVFLTEIGEAPLGASFGVAGYPQHGDNPTDLVRAADQAMYHAKASGGQQAVVYQPEFNSIDC